MSNHQAIINNIKPGDILVSRGINDPVSKVIMGLTKANWSHSFFYIGENKIIESERYGVKIEPLENYLNDRFDVGLFRVTPEITEKQAKKVIKAGRKMLGIHYWYLQLFWYFILYMVGKRDDPDWAIDVSEGMICSEMIANAYETIDIKFKDLPPHQIEPVDFDDSPITIRIA